jgi:hypothetical protein
MSWINIRNAAQTLRHRAAVLYGKSHDLVLAGIRHDEAKAATARPTNEQSGPITITKKNTTTPQNCRFRNTSHATVEVIPMLASAAAAIVRSILFGAATNLS